VKTIDEEEIPSSMYRVYIPMYELFQRLSNYRGRLSKVRSTG
jgi:hypothetical protein